QVVLDRVGGRAGDRNLGGRQVIVVVPEDEDLLFLLGGRRAFGVDRDDAGTVRRRDRDRDLRLRDGLGRVGLVRLVALVRLGLCLVVEVSVAQRTLDVLGVLVAEVVEFLQDDFAILVYKAELGLVVQSRLIVDASLVLYLGGIRQGGVC